MVSLSTSQPPKNMAGADRKSKTSPELPPEILLFHVLPKLPAKSILRFKCVCKQWQSFLTTPKFIKIHLHHVTTVDCYRYEKVLFSHISPSRKFQTINCEDGLVSTTRCYPFRGIASIITSFVNGLACVGIRNNKREFYEIILWNPLTGEYKKLSRPVDTKCYYVFNLYYTCSDDDYKILQITGGSHMNVYIYSLKSDSWRKLESTLDYLERIPYINNHNLLDEKLHFLMRSSTGGYIIIRLDLKTEKLTKIEVPSICVDGCECGCLSLMVGRGCIELTIWKTEPSQQITIEVLKLDGDNNWMKVVTSSYFPAPRTSFLEPLHLMKNGNWLVYTADGICKIDPETNIKEELYSIPTIIIVPHGKYIETFVSPNQYIN